MNLDIYKTAATRYAQSGLVPGGTKLIPAILNASLSSSADASEIARREQVSARWTECIRNPSVPTEGTTKRVYDVPCGPDNVRCFLIQTDRYEINQWKLVELVKNRPSNNAASSAIARWCLDVQVTVAQMRMATNVSRNFLGNANGEAVLRRGWNGSQRVPLNLTVVGTIQKTEKQCSGIENCETLSTMIGNPRGIDAPSSTHTSWWRKRETQYVDSLYRTVASEKPTSVYLHVGSYVSNNPIASASDPRNPLVFDMIDDIRAPHQDSHFSTRNSSEALRSSRPDHFEEILKGTSQRQFLATVEKHVSAHRGDGLKLVTSPRVGNRPAGRIHVMTSGSIIERHVRMAQDWMAVTCLDVVYSGLYNMLVDLEWMGAGGWLSQLAVDATRDSKSAINEVNRKLAIARKVVGTVAGVVAVIPGIGAVVGGIIAAAYAVGEFFARLFAGKPGRGPALQKPKTLFIRASLQCDTSKMELGDLAATLNNMQSILGTAGIRFDPSVYRGFLDGEEGVYEQKSGNGILWIGAFGLATAAGAVLMKAKKK